MAARSGAGSWPKVKEGWGQRAEVHIGWGQMLGGRKSTIGTTTAMIGSPT